MALLFTDENFTAEVLNSPIPVLVDFYAPWCRPCRMLAPVIDRLCEEGWDAKIGKLNVDENQEIARAYKVNAIPTILLFSNGEVADRMEGLVSESTLREAVGRLVEN